MLGIFDIEGTMPVHLEGTVKSKAIEELNLQPPKPSATIEIIFKEGTDVAAACGELYQALTALGLTG
jgi:hypothetical protein